jgi:hypothetical protein
MSTRNDRPNTENCEPEPEATQGCEYTVPAHQPIDVVEIASDDSFPASDPPAYIVTRKQDAPPPPPLPLP